MPKLKEVATCGCGVCGGVIDIWGTGVGVVGKIVDVGLPSDRVVCSDECADIWRGKVQIGEIDEDGLPITVQ